MKTTSETFISNLRRLRKAKYRSQADFAEAVGLSLRGYQKYEQGESSPSPDTLDKFAEVLDCSPWELLQPPQHQNAQVRVKERKPPESSSMAAKPEQSDIVRVKRTKTDEILEILDQRLPSIDAAAEIRRLKAENQALAELIGPHRQFIEKLHQLPTDLVKTFYVGAQVPWTEKQEEGKGIG